MFSFLDADAIFFAFTVSIESGDVKSISFVLFFITLPLRLVTPGKSISANQQDYNALDLKDRFTDKVVSGPIVAGPRLTGRL